MSGVLLAGRNSLRAAMRSAASGMTGLLTAAILVVGPAVTEAQASDVASATVPVSATATRASSGTLRVTYVWTKLGVTVKPEGSVPANALVKAVYLAGAPTGDTALIGQIHLVRRGQVEQLVHVDADGTVSFPTASWPSTTWEGQPVHGRGRWSAFFKAPETASELRLEATLVIAWEVEAPLAASSLLTTGMTGDLDVDDGLVAQESSLAIGKVGDIDVVPALFDGKAGDIEVEPYP